MERLVKLVRDDIAVHLHDDRVIYKPMPPGEYIEHLRKKGIEEAVEYAFTPTVEELADMLEVTASLAKRDMDVGWDELMHVMKEKRRDRGGFELGMGMYVMTNAGRFS
jgi:predicted house-cleaning noncanonical NTP pyrophosphatase (MazG superfamily)